jgi:hypothetical protein
MLTENPTKRTSSPVELKVRIDWIDWFWGVLLSDLPHFPDTASLMDLRIPLYLGARPMSVS